MCAFFIQSRQGHCELCHALVPASHALCTDCLQSLPWLHHACPRCALPLPVDASPGSLCGECLADPPPFDRSIAPLCYRPPVNDLVSRFKYHAGLANGRLLAQILGQTVVQTPTSIQLLLPMPLHPARLRQRGYNQAAELARVVSQASGIPANGRLLKRIQEAPSQREARKRDRVRNVRSAFACAPTGLPGRVAIIDDVITTGATARAAAMAVKKAGAGWVEIWAVARTPKPGH